MIHRMKLRNIPFNLIKNGKKKYELRLYDEKRKLVNVGDFIIFTNIDTLEEIEVFVTSLYLFNNFKDLFSSIDKKDLGYSDNDEYCYKSMDEYYSIDEQKKYGVVAIEIQQKK